ncbi:MAG: hypothetical protein R3F38_06785 [Gammaproteobacteria bacterium]
MKGDARESSVFVCLLQHVRTEKACPGIEAGFENRRVFQLRFDKTEMRQIAVLIVGGEFVVNGAKLLGSD